jgi:hypothetical protein
VFQAEGKQTDKQVGRYWKEMRERRADTGVQEIAQQVKGGRAEA